MITQFFLVGGTNQERYHIARERYIDPRSIRLVNNPSDIYGFREGKIIFGVTGFCEDLDMVLGYAQQHGIEVP